MTPSHAASHRQPHPGELWSAGARRHARRALLASTALQATTALLLVSTQATAGTLAPNTRPTGGAVVAGQASISQTPSQTTVAQSSQRAAVDWQSYSVGSGHTVAYQQPNAASITLNRVIGPDPSQIAGRITANGQVVIVNGSGVVFSQGSQVDAQSLIVSTANVSNANFMAGKLAFNQPGQPDAKISNAGTLTVGAAGLAALVAPQVANSGVINARMGHVVLAGAEAHTIDLYGDGLMSVDVTRQVTHTPSRATALVTNTGTIQADGGTIKLTAQAADGIIQNLVSAGGKLQANTAGGKTGTIVVAGMGGTVSIEGRVKADGKGAGDQGGIIQVLADTVAVRPAAYISASGKGGGGTVAVGTTVQRAQHQGGGVPAGSARAVTVEAGARIAANGRGTGSGGSVAVLSTSGTTMAGSLSARGGKSGGDGGNVEVSSNTGLRITGKVDTLAPKGRAGTLLIDPSSLLISDATTTTDTGSQATDGPQTIKAATFAGFTGNVVLQATDSVTVNGTAAAVTNTGADSVTLSGKIVTVMGQGLKTAGPLTLTDGGLAGGSVNIQALTTSTASTVTLKANAVNVSSDTILPFGGSPLSILATLVSVAPLTPNYALIVAAAPQPQTNSLVLTPADLAALAGSAPTLVLGSIAGTTTAGSITVKADLALPNVKSLGLYSTGAITASAGAVSAPTLTGGAGTTTTLDAPNTNIGTLGPFASSGGAFTLNNGTNALAVGGALNAAGQTVSLTTTAALTETAAGSITAATLTGAASRASLPQNANAVTSLGAFTAQTGFSLADGTPLTVTAPVTAGASGLALRAPSLAVNATLTGTRVDLAADALTTNGTSPAATAVLAIAPSTPGTALTVGTATSGLVLSPALINGLLPPGSTATLELGRAVLPAPPSANPPTPTTTAGSLVVNVAFQPAAAVLGVYSTGAVDASAGPITTPVLTGAAGTTTTLTAPGTNIAALGDYLSTGGKFTLDNGPNALSIMGALNAAGQTVSLSTTGTLTETASGSIAAALLTGNALSANLIPPVTGGGPPGTNRVDTLGPFTANAGFSLTDAVPLTIAGPVSAAAGPIGIFAPTITVLPVAAPAVATINGASVALTAVTSLVVNGTVGACIVTGQPGSGVVVITATDPSGTIAVHDGAIIGGQVSVTLAAPVGVTIDGGLVNGPTLTIGNGLTLSGAGQVVGGTVNLPGGASMSGGTLHADTLNGRVVFNSGDLYGGDGLTVTLGPLVTGQIVTRGPFDADSDGSVVLGTPLRPANIYAGGDATLSISGNLSQRYGTVASNQSLTILATGVIDQLQGASLVAGTALQLEAGGAGTSAAAIAGLLSGGAIKVVEPRTDLTFAPAALDGAGGVSFRVTRMPFDCPGCITTLTGPFAVAQPVVTVGPYRPPTVRVDGGTLELASAIAADTVELHSVGSTLQTGGNLTARSLSGTAGYAFTSGSFAPLGNLPVAGQLPAYAPLLTPGTPTDVGGTVTLAQVANNVGLITGYQVRGDTAHNGLTLQDAPGPQQNALGNTDTPTALTLTGTITAGSAPDVANATLARQNGADITVKTTGDLLLGTTVAPPGNVLLTGRGVTLQSAGNLTETPGSVIVADSLGGNAAIATLPGANQVATLTSFSAPGGFSMTDARNLAITGTVTALTSGPVGIVAKDGTGTPSATEAGQAGIGHLTIASTGVVTGNTVSLTGTDIVVGGQVGACELPGTASGGTVLLTATGTPSASTLGIVTPATIVVNDGVVGGQVAVTLAAPGGVSVNGGIVDAGTSSTTGTVNIGTGLALTGGKVFADTVNVVGGATMTGGLLHANHLTGSISFTGGGDLYDGDPLTVALGPLVTGQIATRGTLTATGAGSVTTSANIYAGRGATLTVNGT